MNEPHRSRESARLAAARNARSRSLLQLVTALIVVVVLERRFAIAQADNVVSLAKPENQAAAAIVQPQWSPSEATLGPGGSW